MLKTRIIGVLVIKGGLVVQSINFKWYLPVGRPDIAVDYLNRWGIDEIVLLDIDATPKSRCPRHDTIVEYSKACHVPLAVGGGITDVIDMENLIRSGADKVVINTAAVSNPPLITDGARLFGSQCIIVSIDVRRMENGKYEVFTESGSHQTGYGPAELAKIAEDMGAGEIFLNSIDRDGSKLGYDLQLIEQVVDAVNIPVIICGGVGCPVHFCEAMKYGVSAVAAANFFHYTEHSVITTKSFLKKSRTNIRLDTYASYDNFGFGDMGRVAKVSDPDLEKLRFEYIPEEII